MPPTSPPPLATAIANLHKKLDQDTARDHLTDTALQIPIPAPPPSSASLAPGRVPAPHAVVVGASLRIQPDSGKAKVGPSIKPSKPAPSGSSLPPAASSSPSSPPKGATPHSPYDKAFRRWSSPPSHEVEPLPGAPLAPGLPGPSPENAVTYQVYTAQDISAGRGPMRSIVALPAEPKKMSFGARVGIGVFALLVVLTVAAVVAVSTEDPRSAPLPASPRVRPTVSVTAAPAAEPTPTMIPVGDPPEDVPSSAAPSTPSPAPRPVQTSVKPPKAKPPSSAAPRAPATAAPPPNPYAK